MEVKDKNEELLDEFLKKNFKGKHYMLHFTVINSLDDKKGDVNATSFSRHTITNTTYWYIAKLLAGFHFKYIHEMMQEFNKILLKSDKPENGGQYR